MAYSMEKLLIYVSAAFMLLFIGCNKRAMLDEGDFFYLQSKGAVMPVWVKGNTKAKKYIIMLHGGPEGGSAQYYTIFPSHKKIEEQFAVVYWDQRMCGMSQGNPSMEEATLEQFTEDLDKLVTLIDFKYGKPKIYLMGHSWGGALATNYLLRHQQKITGWIEIDGGHNWTGANAISRELMMTYARNRIDSIIDAKYWNFALNWYESHSVVGINDNTHYTFVGKANGYDYNPNSDSLSIPFTDLLFFSPVSTAYFFVPYKFSFLNNGLNLQHRLGSITIPSLICWGRHDKVFPVAIGESTYERLGTPAANKYLHLFELSAHSPNYEQPIEFANEVISFVSKY
jgi:pimeloyl-ACP methyl ester carboxylesterase